MTLGYEMQLALSVKRSLNFQIVPDNLVMLFENLLPVNTEQMLLIFMGF